VSSETLIPKHGGYRRLKSFQVAQLVYDVTVRFCDRYVNRYSRTRDQMIQAARSGVQNIAEGSQASGTSKKMELKLTNVARASLEELRLDYEDFLRQGGLSLWAKADLRRQQLVDLRPRCVEDVAKWIRDSRHGCGPSGRSGLGGRERQDGHRGLSAVSTTSYPEAAANAALVLIAVSCGLLDRQLASLAKAFEGGGGFTERLYRVRTARRRRG
jgi:four helix bundle suffix protein